ncbi:MAG: gliding motility-associated C-terminal domain-containing protein [Paludibacteraceae bacterium]
MTGTCIMVGNTNTELVDPIDFASLTKEEALEKEKGDIKEINVDGSSSTSTLTITNSNFADFCTINPDIECGKSNIKYARLTWGGRLQDGVTPDHREEVYVKLDNSTYTLVTSEKTTKAGGPSLGYYSCHADVTDLIKNIIVGNAPIESHRIYVANIQTALNEFTSDATNIPGLCSGWSLTIVYSHPLLPKKNVLVYDCDVLGESNRAGFTPDAIIANFLTDSIANNILNETITFGFSALGGFNSIDGELILQNSDNKIEGKNYNSYKMTNYLSFIDAGGSETSTNPIGSSIYYNYKNGACDIMYRNGYTRGFDLKAFPILAEKYQPTKGAPVFTDAFKLCITPDNEFHYLTNAILMVGAANLPETKLTISSTETTLEPGKEYSTKLYVSVGENQESMRNIKLNIPFSEYIDSVTSISIKVTPQKIVNGYLYYSPKDGSVLPREALYILNSNSTNTKSAEKRILTNINTYLSLLNKNNADYAKKTPYLIENGFVTLDFRELEVPADVKYQDIITINLTLKTKPEGDWSYEKNSKLGKMTVTSPEAEMTVTGINSDQKSVFEGSTKELKDEKSWNDYKCELLSDGSSSGGGSGSGTGGGTGDCAGLNNEETFKGGSYIKDKEKQIKISIDADNYCAELPEKIDIYFCNKMEITVDQINELLKTKYSIDTKAIAFEDSCIWEQAKRDSLANFAKIHGVSKSQMDELLGAKKIVTFAKYGENRENLDAKLKCRGADVDLLADDIDDIINMPDTVTKVYVLFTAEDTLSKYEVSPSYDYAIDINDDNKAGETYEITEDKTLYILYDSPWRVGENGTSKDCDVFIPINFIKKTIDAPILTYDNEQLKQRDTLYYCLDGEILPLTIEKTFNEYDVWADIIKDPDNNPTTIDTTIHVDNTYNKSIDWSIKDEKDKDGNIIVDTKIAGNTMIIIKQKSLSDNCIGENDTIVISVSDFKIADKPTIEVVNGENQCESLNPKDSITLKISNNDNNNNVRWYLNEKLPIQHRVLIGESDEINIRQDTSGTFSYSAVFFKDNCESTPETVYVTLNPKADSLKTDTIEICKYYKPTGNEIITKIQGWNSASWNRSNLLFYNYDKSHSSDLTEALSYAISQDSVVLDTLVNLLQTAEDCPAEGYYFLNFVVQGKTAKGCLGAGSLVTLKVNCYNREEPTMENSTLYCTGDTPTKNIFDFLDQETSKFTQGNKWFWKEETSSVALPENRIGNDVYKTIPDSYDPNTSTLAANSHKFIVVRVDSNNCVSLPDTFKIVVADAINSFAKIGDTTKTISATETSLALNYCKGNIIYSTNRLPAIGYPSKEYIMEWYRKDKVADDCDTLVKYNFDRLLNHVDINFDKVDTTYYCTRQVTAYGCKGPWLNVSMIVHDSVRDIPVIDSSTMVICEGDPSNLIKVSNPDPSQYNLYLYKSDTTEIISNQLTLDTVAGKYLTSLKKNLYFASLKNDITGCYGDLIGIDAIINPKPHLPYPEKDTTVYLCANNEIENLKTKIGADINVLDYNTKLVWEPKESIKTDGNKSALYAVHQIDTVSLCKGEKINIEIKIEKTFDYKPFGKKEFCYGTTISLCDSVEKSIKANNRFIPDNNIGYKVYRLNGTSKQTPALDCGQLSKLGSSKTRNASDSTRYLIEVMDTISGCFEKDTATIIFRGLPTIKKIEDIVICQFVDTLLPTPTDNKYSYKWLREDDDQILPKPEKLQLTKSETIRLIANDEMGCYDTLAVNMVVNKEPKSAIAYSDTFCQNSGIHLVPVTINPSADINAGSIKIEWFGANNDPIKTPINTDTVNMTGLTKVFTYTIRQIVQGSNCYKDTTINITIKKALDLKMLDLDRVCQPNTVDFDTNVWDYLGANTNDVNLANLNNIDVKYAMLNNGTKTDKTKEEVSKLEYMDGKDSVEYIYTVTDADKVCVASDTVFVTINRKPTTPIIENGLDTIYFCKDDAPILLGAKDINPDLTKTDIFWGEYTSTLSNDSLNITESYRQYTAYSKDKETGCVSEHDTIFAYISNPLKFSTFGTKEYCYGEVVDLTKMIDEAIKAQNQHEFKSNIGFNVYKMNGSTPSAAINREYLSSLHSTKGRNTDDSTLYNIEITDSISGCHISDRFSIIFRGLPTIGKTNDIVICQYTDTLLPTPTDNRYEYVWLRADNRQILPKPETLQLEESETIRLIATDTMGCSDTLKVNMDVKKIPTSAIAQNITLCQNSGLHLIPVKAAASEDNGLNTLSIQWFGAKNDSIDNPINTDTVTITGLKKVLPYTIRQTNNITGCYKDTTIQITVNRAIDLHMTDPTSVCQPEVVDLNKNVWDYLRSNTEAIHLTNLENIYVEYALLNNGKNSPLTKDEVSKLKYRNGKDSVPYIYTVTDAEKVCSASDTVFVTINRKPSTPIIENGLDTIYFCQDNAPLYIQAKDTNTDTEETEIFWGEYTKATRGDSLLIAETKKEMLYQSFTQNKHTSCTSNPDSIIVIIASPIGTSPIGKNGTIELCVGEHINVMDTARSSFKIDEKRKSIIEYTVSANGFEIAEDELHSVTRTTQDTIHYIFTATDKLTGCHTANQLRLIFHKKPTFSMEGKKTLCQGNDIELKAAGEQRAVSYQWQTEGHEKIESTTASLLMKNIMADTTILLIEKLEGTGCFDTLIQKIKVYETPKQLEDKSFYFCQDKEGSDKKVLLNRDVQDSEKFKLQWLDFDNTEMFVGESIDIPVVNDSSYTYFVKQINIKNDTICHGEISKVTFTINKHIDVTLRDTNVCMPTPFNLALYAEAKRQESVAGYELTVANMTSIENNTEKNIADSTQITESGIYKIRYTDKNGCKTENQIKINFIKKPEAPIFADEMPVYLCQGIDTTIAPNLIAGNYVYLWNKIGDNDTLTTDTLRIEASRTSGSPVHFEVWRKDSVYGCESEKSNISYQVLDSIKTSQPEALHICEYETIDLDSTGHQIFSSSNTLELKVFTADEQAEPDNQLLYYNAINKAGYYLIKATDIVSNCHAKALVRLEKHESPVLLFKGDTILCSKDQLSLTAYPKEGAETPNYQWTDANGNSIDNSTISYPSTIEDGRNTLRKDTLLLTGTYNVTNSKSCIKTRNVEITTHPIPEQLGNDTIDLCQNTGVVAIPVNYQDDSYNLKTYQSDSSEISGINVNTDSIGNSFYMIRQENRITKCLSESATILVNIRSAIHLDLDTATGICEPHVFPLEEMANEAAKTSNLAIKETKKYTINSITRNGVEVSDRNAISQTGLYQVTIADQYGCEAGDTIRLTVNQQPKSISGDTAFCQNTGVQILNKKGTGNGLTVEWLDLGNAYPDSIFTDTLKINTDMAEVKNYMVRQKYTSSNCASVPSPMTITIHPAILSELADTSICFGNIFNLPVYAQSHVSEGDEPYVSSYKRTETIVPLDYNAIAQTGTFVINYTDKNRCSASDTMTLSVSSKIELAIEGNKPVCTGDTIRLKASGAEHYIWNQTSDDKDTILIVTTTAGKTDVSLSASTDINENTHCHTDTTISISVHKVPDLIKDFGDTLYCQKSQTEVLSLTATDPSAKIVWYDPNDNYTSVSQNGTLKPSSMHDGEFIYKFRQQLGECSTELQDYLVTIQESIDEVAIIQDTTYCKGEETAPLSAKWSNPQYDVIWTNSTGDNIPANYQPSSDEVGVQKYQARLSFKACLGEPAEMNVSVQDKYGETPDIDDSFTFCQNTGSHTLLANNVADNVRLNWYQEGSEKRMDSIIVNTNSSTWKNNSYLVTQSIINGCESQSKKVVVNIADEIKPITIHIDTCANQSITLDDVMSTNRITEKATTLWNGMDSTNRMDIHSNIGHTGDYQFLVKDQYGCTAIHTIEMKMMKVEDFSYPNISKIYCYDDTVKLQAKSSNSTMIWENQSTGLIHYGDSYELKLEGMTDISLIATVTNKPACKDTIDIKLNTHPKTEAQIIGKTNVCLKEQVKLTTGNLYQTSWNVGDSTIQGDDFIYTPKKSELVNVSGLDKNSCPASKIIAINTANIPDPKILITPEIKSSIYHLNRDTTELQLTGIVTAAIDGNYTFDWEMGDGERNEGNNISYTYDKAIVRLTKPIEVKLNVTHEYGCSGETSTLVLIDPDFEVPNTMTQEDEFMADYELQIFDRIGNLIYEGIGWHGQKNNGEEAFSDTYFYAITYYAGGEKKIKTGYITLVR